MDLSSFIGTHEWQIVNNVVVPDLDYISKVLLLLVFIYFFIKGLYALIYIIK